MRRSDKKQIVIVSGSLLLIGILLRELDQIFIANIAFLLASAFAGIPIVIKAYQSLRLRIISIELLVTIAVTGAIIIGEYVESAAVTFLFLFGAYLESRTLEKTRSSLRSLMDLAPQQARILLNNQKMFVPVEDVKERDIVFVQSGEKIPVDGKVRVGHASVNEATITGEAIPVLKSKNDKVYSGTILDTGYLELEAERVGENTTFSKILQLVEEAQDSKAKTQKYLERFASFYTPIILLLAIVVFLFSKDIELTLTFLVISCPGALVISAPVSIVAGIGNGAKNGILLKGGEIVEQLSQIDVVAFDKTGTLTVGTPEVSSIKAFGISEKELLELSATAELFSEHHLGKAIVKEADKRNIALNKEPREFRVFKGKGIEAKVAERQLVIGTRKLLLEYKIQLDDKVRAYVASEEEKGQTVVLVSDTQTVLGVISISDQLRPEAVMAIQKIKQSGIKKIVMLTGDNIAVAEIIANQLKLDGYYAELLPEQKVERIKNLKSQGYKVAMVGDGINDAPAIASADIGIAMGGAGTDVAMETADVVLMSDRLDRLPLAVKLARATVLNMKQNMYFAVAIVVLLLVGVLTKTVFLASGMFIHEASVLLVILNAIRLVRYKDKQKNGIIEYKSNKLISKIN
ncbi:heavy metal translocating P-type ATPase [Fredinandcohnia sp. 179-A 10B2 NHS]|uniref:heavy metal translocating P-type ATPase n=1 Tax=Fredinandcohnia sp. 179-A 10B2 NHS TaxID=3235176 RepID=UPI0039A3BEED